MAVSVLLERSILHASHRIYMPQFLCFTWPYGTRTHIEEPRLKYTVFANFLEIFLNLTYHSGPQMRRLHQNFFSLFHCFIHSNTLQFRSKGLQNLSEKLLGYFPGKWVFGKHWEVLNLIKKILPRNLQTPCIRIAC